MVSLNTRKKSSSRTFKTATVLIAVVLMFTGMVWADSDGVWHEAENVRGEVFGADEGYPNYVFNSTVEFAPNGKIEMGSNNINNVGRINMQGIIDMNNNNIEQAKNIYANVFYDRDNTGYAIEPASNSNMKELTLNGVLRMNDNNVGGKNGQGVRKVNFENHEWSHFSCSDDDDVAGSLFYDRSEGVALCRKGNIEELATKSDVAGVSDTDAATHCSGNNVFLDGNGNCRDITTNYGSPIHGDLIQSNTVDSGEIEDGSGSNLDADMVDGKHASEIGGSTIDIKKVTSRGDDTKRNSVSCPSGYTVIGGGCSAGYYAGGIGDCDTAIQSSSPSKTSTDGWSNDHERTGDGWDCRYYDNNCQPDFIWAYAWCMKQ